MGDLKKKKPINNKELDYIVDTDDGKQIIIEHGSASSDEQVMDRLRGYIQEFYKKQEEKLEKEEKSNKEGE